MPKMIKRKANLTYKRKSQLVAKSKSPSLPKGKLYLTPRPSTTPQRAKYTA